MSDTIQLSTYLFVVFIKFFHYRQLHFEFQEIFGNIDYLPTFSSTAIEHNLHKIAGLSEKFIYLNDDIFFGLHTSLDDFYTEEKGTKVILAPKI
jgi:hypothetical protein